MVPSQKSKRNWVIFGVIIAILAIVIAVGPVIIARYMRAQTGGIGPSADFMIKVQGIVKQTQDIKYLKGNNNLYYILITSDVIIQQTINENMEKEAVIFGNIVPPSENETVEGNPVRMRIDVQSVTPVEEEAQA